MSAAIPASRIVRGTQALQAAVEHIAGAGAWFTVDPLPHDRYAIWVKPEAAHLLPILKDWAQATDDELLDVARRHYGTDFSDPDPDTRLVPENVTAGQPTIIVTRTPEGFVVSSETWIPYPEGEA